MKPRRTILLALASLTLFAGSPIDITQLPIEHEVHVVAIDIKVNPSNMPDGMLWDKPIMLVYAKVDSFDNIRADVVRNDLTTRFNNGTYQPVVLRSRQYKSLTLHFMNLIGEGEAPVRLVQGAVCKSCPPAKAYTFSYGNTADENQYPTLASIHAHGVTYDIEHDGTRAGNNLQQGANYDGLVPPGQQRTYFYKELDVPGLWPMHDHANPAHSVARGLHMALIVEPERSVRVDHDFLMIFSDYPEYDAYIDDFFGGLLIPPFLHMQNSNVMHAHALNGYAAMIPPRMRMSVGMGATKWDAMRTDLIGEPRTPVYETELGDLVRIRFLSMGSSITHSFHLHGHVWWDEPTQKYVDNIAIPAGDTRSIMFYAGGDPFHSARRRNADIADNEVRVRSGSGDWLYHCHIIPHVKHGMWGVFRVNPATPKSGN